MNKKETIMFVGAGSYQVPGIVKAKEMGLNVLAIDGNPAAEGLKIANMGYALDVRNCKKALKIAKKHRINGVLTIATEVAVPTVAFISEKLKLPGNGTNIAERTTNKFLMRKIFQQNGLPSPEFVSAETFVDLETKLNNLHFPVVMKPVDNAGSRGVNFVKNKNEAKSGFKISKDYSRSGSIIIEEFMSGVEVSVEAFVCDNSIHIIGLSDKIRTEPPYLLDTDVIFPTKYSGPVKKAIIKIVEKAINAIGIISGPVHMELIMTEEGPVPVELASRGPGFKVFTDILPAITGIDMVKNCILAALGKVPNFKKTKKRAAALHFLSADNGILKAVSGLNEARQIKGIEEIDIYVAIGAKINNLTCGADRIGHIIAISDTRKEAVKSVRKAQKKIKMQYE